MEVDDESAVSEITILPDGRVFVLGASRQVLEILDVLNPKDAGLKQRLERAGSGAPEISGAEGCQSERTPQIARHLGGDLA